MDLPTIANLLFRWMHILAAITAVGGTIFARAVVMPALAELPSDHRATLHAAMRARWSKIVAAAIALLLASGLYNFAMIIVHYQVPRWYHPVFGVKFLLALVIFMIASLLVGKTAAAEQLRRNQRLWMNVNIALAVTVVVLSGILRSADKVPKTSATTAEPAAASVAE